ncbi:MAG: histidine kinase [Clostridia bacterium]|nr:histidine kinase [Clostridia bacterium]
MRNNTNSSKRIVLYFVHFFILVCFVAVVIVMTNPYEANDDTLVKLSFFSDVEIDNSKPDVAVIRGRLAQTVPRNQSVLLYCDKLKIEMEKNGYPFFVFTAEEDRTVMRGIQFSQWLRFYSPGISSWDNLTIKLESQELTGKPVDVESFIDNLYMGDKYALLANSDSPTRMRIINGVVLIVLGLLYVLSMIMLGLTNIRMPQRYHACGFLLMCAGVCILLDFKVASLVFKNVLALAFVDQLMQLVMCVLMLVYFAEFFKTTVRRNIVQGMAYFWMAVSVIYSVCRLTGIADTFDYMSVLTAVTAIMLAATMILLLTESKPKDMDIYTQMLLVSGLILSAAGLLSALPFNKKYEIMPLIYQIGVAVFVVLQYIIFINRARTTFELVRKSDEMEREIRIAKGHMLSSRIQPYFMYNTLTSISALCDRDAGEAKEAIQNFARFLRGSIDSVSLTEMIPFSREMEHVKAYLSLEQMRYGEDLKVIYDIEEENFRLPSLTIQPIVENAVKHGVGKKESGGTVTLVTRRAGLNLEIMVSDDGAGFIMGQNYSHEGGRQSGIDSVKARLEAMCGGKISIVSTLGAGTTVTMTIPYDNVKLK